MGHRALPVGPLGPSGAGQVGAAALERAGALARAPYPPVELTLEVSLLIKTPIPGWPARLCSLPPCPQRAESHLRPGKSWPWVGTEPQS